VSRGKARSGLCAVVARRPGRALAALLLTSVWNICIGQSISKQAAVRLAEAFVAGNGYTNLPSEKLKPELDMESIEWAAMLGDGSETDKRRRMLYMRFNSLQSKAIGVRRDHYDGRGHWSVAFDFVSGERRLFVGLLSHIRVEHKDGFRKYFAGFDHD
jgi:hypothetical protein